MAEATAIEVRTKGGNFEVTNRPTQEPGRGQVRIKVEACGVCHGDAVCKFGFWPGMTYPRIPGHEIVGTIDALGEDVTGWNLGQRVGTGWHGGHCGQCRNCRRGDFMECESGSINGLLKDGGYAEYVTVAQNALVHIECDWSSAEIAPLICAGVTTFNALRYSGAIAGQTVAIQGIGGLGHLAVQFANKMGFRVVAISSGAAKREQALRMGAHIYIDTSSQDVVAELKNIGGANVILATAPNAQAISDLVPALATNGKLIVVGAPHDKLSIDGLFLLGKRASVTGWPGGSPADIEDTIAFAALTNCRPLIQTFPLKDASSAFESMIQNKVRFRAVLVM